MDDYEIRRKDVLEWFLQCKEVKNCKVSPEVVVPATSEAKEKSDDGSSDEDVDIMTISDNEILDCESYISEESCTSQKLKSASSCSSLTVHACTYEGCDKFFSRPSRLNQHIRTHTGERPFVCPSENCSRSYTRQQHLKRHIETSHQDKEVKELKCEICGKMVSNIYSLRKHVLRFHESRKHECNECGQSFTKQQQLQRHTYIHTGIKPFLCDYPGCEMRCMNLSVLKRHKLIHQKSRYVCPQESCQQKFDAYKDLQHHIKDEHPKVCDICGRPFQQLRCLKKHRRTHDSTGEAYFCTYPACDKYYVTLSNLKTHIKTKHQQQNIYECGVCEKRLSTKQKLIHHMTTHSPSYKRSYATEKPRKPRKDKGCSRQDLARLLSGYSGKEEGDDMFHTILPENTAEKDTNSDTSLNAPQNTQKEERRIDVLESKEIS